MRESTVCPVCPKGIHTLDICIPGAGRPGEAQLLCSLSSPECNQLGKDSIFVGAQSVLTGFDSWGFPTPSNIVKEDRIGGSPCSSQGR